MRNLFYTMMVLLVLSSCKTPGSVFNKQTAHEQYGEKLNNVGLKENALGNQWFAAAAKAVNQPITVQLPYQESGYFAAGHPDATGLRFDAKRGEQLIIELTKNPLKNFLFGDLFNFNNGVLKFIQSIDTITNGVRYTVKENGNFILRLQPELLQSGSYTLVIKTGPSLAYPVAAPTSKNRIISYWGAGRDGGARSHEGVDIGGDRGTALIAAGNGTVSSVSENNLGGKVVFIRSAESNETWYYAHLDSQIATPGQRVKTGDIIGLMGNTGNARTTSPHLHFGIYTMGGAIDPLAFINPVKQAPKPVIASIEPLGKQVRLHSKSSQLYFTPEPGKGEKSSGDMPVTIIAATQNLYKVKLPTGEIRFVPAANTVSLDKRIKPLLLKTATHLTDAPQPGAPVIKNLEAGIAADLLAASGSYQYIEVNKVRGWIVQQ